MTIIESKSLLIEQTSRFLEDRWSWGLIRKFNRMYNAWYDDREMKSELGFVVVKLIKYFIKHPDKKRSGEDLLKLYHFSLRNHLIDISRKEKKRKMWFVNVPFDIIEMNFVNDLENKKSSFLNSINISRMSQYIKYLERKRKKTKKSSFEIFYKKFGKRGLEDISLYLISRDKFKEERRLNMKITENEVKYLKRIVGIDELNDDFVAAILRKFSDREFFGRMIRRWIDKGFPEALNDPTDCFASYNVEDTSCVKCSAKKQCKEAVNLEVGVKATEMKKKMGIPVKDIINNNKKIDIKKKVNNKNEIVNKLEDLLSDIGNWVQTKNGGYKFRNVSPFIYVLRFEREKIVFHVSKKIKEYFDENKYVYKEGKSGLRAYLSFEQAKKLIENYST